MNSDRSHSVAELSHASRGLFDAQNVHIHGGTFNSAGTQHNYYGEGSAVNRRVTYEHVELALKSVLNYRDIHEANLSKATKGTGPKFDEWKEYCEWLIPGGMIKTMWGIGMPGAGKTIFAAITLNTIEAHAEASEKPICVAYIYFRYSDHTKATTQDFLEVLVKQTLERHPECRPIAIKVYTRHIQEKTRPSEDQLLNLLQQLVGMMLATFCFLDAMDEAPAKVQVDLLEKLSSLNINLFITSRPMVDLQARFPTAHCYPIRAQDHDLDLHIRKEISRSAVLQNVLNRSGPQLLADIMTTVKAKCDGMFLHAWLQLEALQDCTSVYDIEQVLSGFPSEIEDVYQQTWRRIQDQPAAQALIGRNVLLWVLCAERSLGIGELKRLVAACPETYKVNPRRIVDEEILMGLCRGLVAVEEKGEGDDEDDEDKETRIVRFVHYTAKDVVKGLVSKTNPHPHSIPTQVCLALLVEHGFQRSTIDSAAALNEATAKDPLLQYAYKSWSFHAKQSLGYAAAEARVAEFIQGCSSFPVDRHHPDSWRLSGWDCFQSLHMAAYFDLPLSLAGSASLREPNLLSSKGGYTPLMLAVIMNSIQRVEELLAQPHILVNSINSEDGETALLLASYSSRDNVFHLLSIQDESTPLTLASRFSHSRGVPGK